jgi:hypothetical protein
MTSYNPDFSNRFSNKISDNISCLEFRYKDETRNYDIQENF